MIEVPTVLVLGAGASAPFGFPTGQALKDQICSPNFRQAPNVRYLNSVGFRDGMIRDFARALSRSGRPSVDAFLEYRDDFVEVGKAAIAAVLLSRENTGELFENWINRRKKRNERERPADQQEGNWYEQLYGGLCDGTPFDEVDKNKLSVITFNYDRSLEQYLFEALKNSYNKSEAECAEKLSKIPITHVHGSLGRLPWQATDKPEEVVAYESNLSPRDMRTAAGSIKIIPEATTETPEFVQARDLIVEASRLFFLGFGYHPTNMRRLVQQLVRIPREIMGTSLGLSHTRRQAVCQWNPVFGHELLSTGVKDVYAFLHEHIELK